MQKQITLFKSVIQGVESYFHFDSSCSTEIAKSALLDCLKWIGQIEDSAKAAQTAAEEAKGVAQSAEEVVAELSSDNLKE